MGFVHGYLLAGLAMVALPVLFHLLMKQKPKRIKFPAIRFLLQKTKQKPEKNEHSTLVAFTFTHVGGGLDMFGVITAQNYHG